MKFNQQMTRNFLSLNKVLAAISFALFLALSVTVVRYEKKEDELEKEIQLLNEMDSEKRGLIRRLIKENERLFAEMKEAQR